MNSIPLILSPVSSPWIPWVMLALLLLWVVIEIMGDSAIASLPKLFSMPERSYSNSTNRLLTDVLGSLFRVGTLALVICVSLWQGQSVSLVTYLMIIGIAYALAAVRQLVIRLLYAVFRFAPQREMVSKHYIQFASLTAMLMYLSLLVLTNWACDTVPYVSAVLIGVFLLCVLQMVVRVYMTKWLSLVYIGLGFMYLEILPLWLLVTGSMHVIEN
ncbi:MAG: hypothetical protein KBS42_02320 [Bacteroidales bacterium]|nr:hypothetical protein [Candidatus Colicola coprequi]